MEWFCLLAGVVLGMIIAAVATRNTIDGTLRVDNSDGEGPYLFVELSCNVDDILQKNVVCFSVHREDYLTHK